MAPAADIVGHDMARVLPKDAPHWWRTKHLRHLNLLILPLLLTTTGFGYDGSLINGFQSLSVWQDYFGNPTGVLLGLLTASINIGPIIASAFVAWMSDRYGRLKTSQVGCVSIIGASILQTAAHNYAMFVAARFLLGVGISFYALSAPVLINELAYPTHRSRLSSAYQTFYFAGAIIASWTIYGTGKWASSWAWRFPSLLQIVIPAYQVVAYTFWVPESPRWLVGRGRVAEARAVLVKYHAGGDEHSPLVKYEMEQIQDYLLQEREQAALRWSDAWRTTADKRRLGVTVYVALMSQMVGNAVVSYYLSLILDSVGISDTNRQTLINGILQIYNWIVAIAGSQCVDRLGRRFIWLLSVTGMLVSYIVWTACSALYDVRADNQGFAVAVLVLVFLFQGFYSFGLTPLQFAYCGEILPFHQRQKGLALMYWGNSCALLFNNLVTPVALEAIHWRYYLVFIAFLLVSVFVVFFFFPETKGHTLEECSVLFDGPLWSLRKADGRSSAAAAAEAKDDLKGSTVVIEQVESVASR